VRDTCALDAQGVYQAKGFNFLLAKSADDFSSEEEGLIGLTRSIDREYDTLIDLLKKQGKIQSRVFAFYMSDIESSIQIGDWDPSYLRDPDIPINYVKLMDNTMFWDVPVSSVRIGYNNYYSNGVAKAWTFRKTVLCCLDTGTTAILVPVSFFTTFMASLLKDKSPYYDEESESYYASCDLKLYESVYI
jgi:hypothetical protein